MGSDLHHTLRPFCHLGGGLYAGRKEKTAHGTQAAGYLGGEAVDEKAMIDFFWRSFCEILLLVSLCCLDVGLFKVQLQDNL